MRGLVAPFALGLGYVWVDTFTPQHVAYSMLSEIPVSQVMGVATLVAYLAVDRKSPPRLNAITVYDAADGGVGDVHDVQPPGGAGAGADQVGLGGEDHPVLRVHAGIVSGRGCRSKRSCWCIFFR
ncbi:MAG: DUF5935 domain-containing protein [Rhodospirillales bacterium]